MPHVIDVPWPFLVFLCFIGFCFCLFIAWCFFVVLAAFWSGVRELLKEVQK